MCSSDLVNPVISLVLGSLYLGLSTGLGITKTIETITGGFGEIMVEVGLLIAFGVLMGSILNETGAIRRLVEHLLRVFGPKNLPYTMALALGTALQSIFLDVLLVISAPLARRMAPKLGKLGTARMAAAMAISLECGIVFMVPGVASLALAGLLGVPLGKMLIFGFLVVVPTIIISIAIMTFLFKRGFWKSDRDEQHLFDEEDFPQARSSDAHGPAAYGVSSTVGTPDAGGTSPRHEPGSVALAEHEGREAPLLLLFTPLLLSLALIATGAVVEILGLEIAPLKLVGDPVVALLIGLIGTTLVGRYTVGQKSVENAIASGFKESGQILLLTGVGGSLAATVAAAGLGDILGGFFGTVCYQDPVNTKVPEGSVITLTVV